jgi:hypothetical protein
MAQIYRDAERLAQTERFISGLQKQGLDRATLIQKALDFNDENNDPPLADGHIIHMVNKAIKETEKTDKEPQFFHDSERRNQLAQAIRKWKAQGVTADAILQNARTFNQEKNLPPLPDSDIKHLMGLLLPAAKKNTGRVSMYESRTVTLSNGRKVTMRGAEIIGLNE